MFNWASDITVYVIPESFFGSLNIPAEILDLAVKPQPLDFLVDNIKKKTLTDFEVRGALSVEDGGLVIVPKKQTLLEKVTPTSQTMKGIGGLLGSAGILGALGGAIIAGTAYAAEKTIKSLTPDKDENPKAIKKIFGAIDKFSETLTKYKVSMDDLVYIDNSTLEIYLTDRGGRSGLKKFFDVDETADQGINLFIGELVHKDSVQRGLVFYISGAGIDDIKNTLKKEGVLDRQFHTLNRIEKKSWSLY
jgi:hypothetical protein